MHYKIYLQHLSLKPIFIEIIWKSEKYGSLVLTSKMLFAPIFVVIFAIRKSKYVGIRSFKAIGGGLLSEVPPFLMKNSIIASVIDIMPVKIRIIWRKFEVLSLKALRPFDFSDASPLLESSKQRVLPAPLLFTSRPPSGRSSFLYIFSLPLCRAHRVFNETNRPRVHRTHRPRCLTGVVPPPPLPRGLMVPRGGGARLTKTHAHNYSESCRRSVADSWL